MTARYQPYEWTAQSRFPFPSAGTLRVPTPLISRCLHYFIDAHSRNQNFLFCLLSRTMSDSRQLVRYLWPCRLHCRIPKDGCLERRSMLYNEQISTRSNREKSHTRETGPRGIFWRPLTIIYKCRPDPAVQLAKLLSQDCRWLHYRNSAIESSTAVRAIKSAPHPLEAPPIGTVHSVKYKAFDHVEPTQLLIRVPRCPPKSPARPRTI